MIFICYLGNESLDVAEEAMLESYCVKARVSDGMEILDLGKFKFVFMRGMN